MPEAADHSRIKIKQAMEIMAHSTPEGTLIGVFQLLNYRKEMARVATTSDDEEDAKASAIMNINAQIREALRLY